MIADILFNPVLVGVIVMVALCLCRVNVYFSVVVAALTCALLGGASLMDAFSMFIAGMANNCTNVFCLLLFGMLAVAMTNTGLGDVLAPRVAKLVGKKTWILVPILFIIGAMTETIIIIYVAFVPIVIPPLLKLFNELKIDRRLLVTVIVAGLQTGYVCIPVGYGLYFMEMVRSDLSLNGLEVTIPQVVTANLCIVAAMIVAVIMAYILYRKPREYKIDETAVVSAEELPKMEWKHWAAILSGLVAVVVQSVTESMALGAFCSVVALLVTGAVKLKDFDEVAVKGIDSMSSICFVLLAATGFANVCRTVGDLDTFINSLVTLIGGSQFLGALIMLGVGLLVTIGIGTAWGTVPIVAAILTPMAARMGFSPLATILLVSTAAALGDAGSPASDQTLVPSAGFNMDGQHDHIRDTCIPTFICINIPLFVFGLVFSLII